MEDIADLAAALWAAKQSEDTAKAVRIGIEERLAALVETPENGSKTVAAGNGLKVVIKRALSYEADVAAIQGALGGNAPVKLIPAELVFDEKAYESLRATDPANFGIAAKYVTTKPRKVSVTLKLA